MDLHDIPYLSIAQLGELIKSKEISSLEATEAYLERISQIDGVLNSYITVTYRQINCGWALSWSTPRNTSSR